MIRRTLLLSATAAIAARAAAAAPIERWRRLGAEAYAYLLPLFEIEAARRRFLASGGRINVLRHVRLLADARSRGVTTPNNDTLYSSAWLDLTSPVEIALPAVGDRYVSLALMDAFSNNFAILHPERATERRVKVVGPAGQAAASDLRAPTSKVWALARTYVAGPQDLAAAHTVQDGLLISASLAPNEAPEPLPDRSDVAAFFRVASALLAHTELPVRDASFLRRLAVAGIGPGQSYPGHGLDHAAAAAFEAGAREKLASLKFGDGPVRDGWIYPRPFLGDFGLHYGYRASIALTGLAALPIQEAMYLKGVGDAGAAIYGGANRYLWSVRGGELPPVDGFWSLALYEQTPSGQLYFYDNPIGLYSIGSNTPGLRRDGSGGLSVMISHTPPSEHDGPVNWLPAPAGPFALQLRAFRPRAEFLRDLYHPPAVRRLNA